MTALVHFVLMCSVCFDLREQMRAHVPCLLNKISATHRERSYDLAFYIGTSLCPYEIDPVGA